MPHLQKQLVSDSVPPKQVDQDGTYFDDADENREVLMVRLSREWGELCAKLVKRRPDLGNEDHIVLSQEDLLEHWCVEQQLDGIVDDEMTSICIVFFFDQTDLGGNNEVSEAEWIHYWLLQATSPSMHAMLQVNRRLSSWMEKDETVQRKLLALFMETVDYHPEPRIAPAQLRSAIQRWMRGRYNLRSRMVCHEEQQSFWHLKELLESGRLVNGSMPGSLSYFDFLAHMLGCQRANVQLYQYDMSHGRARWLPSMLVGQQLDGIWHTSVVVFGREYWYGGRICSSEPGTGPFGSPTKIVKLPEQTLRTSSELLKYLRRDLARKFTQDNYDVLTKNCNHFSDALCKFLLNRSLPEDVLRQADRIMNSRAVMMLRPLLNRTLGGMGEKQLQTLGSSDQMMERSESRPAVLMPQDEFAHLVEGNLVLWHHREGWTRPARILKVTGAREKALCDVRWLDPKTGTLNLKSSVSALDLRPREYDEASIMDGEATEPRRFTVQATVEVTRSMLSSQFHRHRVSL